MISKLDSKFWEKNPNQESLNFYEDNQTTYLGYLSSIVILQKLFFCFLNYNCLLGG